ncbi:MAG: cryptochrome/photolyase family protein [Bacteroidota bacterium]
MKEAFAICWFRRDLRLEDNKALYHALVSGYPVIPLFIFDEDIIESLPADDHRVTFIYNALSDMHGRLKRQEAGVLVRKGRPFDVFREVIERYPVAAVFANSDHEPYGIQRDEQLDSLFHKNGIAFYRYLDHLVLDKDDVLTSEGKPYQVFTPYSRKWKEVLQEDDLTYMSSEDHLSAMSSIPGEQFSTLESMGFRHSELKAPALEFNKALIEAYHANRDYPAKDATSRLGVHLRFGTMSIRVLVRKAMAWNKIFLGELIWREFYANIMRWFPEVVDRAFKPAYDRIEWRDDEASFNAWAEGQTGYPMVDAGMRQLNATGYMHNRLRMVTASFLSKHLLIDWRRGEAYFARKLFDYELSSNNGGWQWSAGTGSDAAPYFRIFNPASQQKRFDPDGSFVKQWVPEAGTKDYPDPVVDHKQARERCLRVFKEALQS